jgi:hypothetical protein
MQDELLTMMLVVLFAAVMVVAGQVFIDQRKRTEVVMFLDSLAASPALASPRR